jgi:NAD(P)-dependent dehydrogenase (short-subunit alcohol dehydrogenase family)
MRQTVVITGGTDGLGKGLALHYLRRGARVIAIGSTPAKGAALLEEAAAIRAGGQVASAATRADGQVGDQADDRMLFLRADLTSVAATRNLLAEIARACSSVDKLILCAQRYQLSGPRTVTPEGFERGFALGYLSRYVLSHGLRPVLAAAPAPVVMNVGTPGVPLGRIHWDDLQLARGYGGAKATLQAFRANDLLGVAFAHRYADSPVPYVAYHPGVVSTGMPDHLAQPLRALAKGAFALFATSVPKALAPMVRLLDAPPAEPFTAHQANRQLPLDTKAFDLAAALRLDRLTRELIDER